MCVMQLSKIQAVNIAYIFVIEMWVDKATYLKICVNANQYYISPMYYAFLSFFCSCFQSAISQGSKQYLWVWTHMAE